jgi:hypothetical protein
VKLRKLLSTRLETRPYRRLKSEHSTIGKSLHCRIGLCSGRDGRGRSAGADSCAFWSLPDQGDQGEEWHDLPRLPTAPARASSTSGACDKKITRTWIDVNSISTRKNRACRGFSSFSAFICHGRCTADAGNPKRLFPTKVICATLLSIRFAIRFDRGAVLMLTRRCRGHEQGCG